MIDTIMLVLHNLRHIMQLSYRKSGFTIVELLIVIVVIAILAAITVVAYNGIQQRAHNVALQSTLVQIKKRLDLHMADNGSYPTTSTGIGSTNSTTLGDSNCTWPGQTSTSEWIPGFSDLPQGNFSGKGVSGVGGCYLYISNGTSYVLAAWNVLPSPQVTDLYRRIGFRERNASSQYYLCSYNNHPVGGVSSGVYNPASDIYKHSMVITNITNCSEVSPAGS
jgi:prepilin-type N-terminal cleavage/methylation domain-containing protein